jgi:hypothetical protein
MSRRIDCLTETDRPAEPGLQAPPSRGAMGLAPAPIELDELPRPERVSPDPFYRTDLYRLVTPYTLDPARFEA